MTTQDIYKIGGAGTVASGKVVSGTLKAGQTVVFAPSGMSGEVRSIETHKASLPLANPGDNIGFNIRGLSVKQLAKGMVCGVVGQDVRAHAVSLVMSICYPHRHCSPLANVRASLPR